MIPDPAALDRFALEFPEAAAGLLARDAVDVLGFGSRFNTYLDSLVRSQAVGNELEKTVSTLAGILATEGQARSYWTEVRRAAVAATMGREHEGKLRSLWGTTPLINLLPAVKADHLAGMDAETVVWTTYHIESGFDVVLQPQFSWLQENSPSLIEAYSWLVVTWALMSFDNFFYFNDAGLAYPAGGYGSKRFGINLAEMRLLRESGKHLFTLTYGADHRTRQRTLASNRFNFCMHCPEPGRFCICDDEAGRRVMETIARHATSMLAWGLSIDYIPDPRRVCFLVIDTDAIAPDPPHRVAPRADDAPLRLLHSPNHPHFKGSDHLLGAVERLRQEGLPIELEVTSGKTNVEILEAMKRADVVVDQLISGNHGYTAIEAMAVGKPVICYLRDRAIAADPDECPIIEASPDTIEDVLRALVERRGELPAIGSASRRYVEKHHSLQRLARELDALYLDAGAPSTGRVDPDEPRSFSSILGKVTHEIHLIWLAAASGLDSMFITRAKEWRQPGLAERAVWFGKRRLYELFAGPRTVARLAARFARAALRTSLDLAIPVIERLCAIIGARITERRIGRGRPRSVWGTTPILTLPRLAACDRLLGLESRSLVYTTYHVTSDFDINLQSWRNGNLQRWPDLYPRFLRLALCYALLRFDVFHFFCDRAITLPERRMGLNRAELATLRAAGKRIYTYTYGADVRTRGATRQALGETNFCMKCPNPGQLCICDDELGRQNIDAIRRYATAMTAMGDMLLYIEDARPLHFWPVDLSSFPQPAHDSNPLLPLRVGHAPNHPYFKGTDILEEAVDALQARGVEIELVRVQGVPNSEVLDMLASIDVLAEQFIGGFHGYTALEAMALGRPVICHVARREWLADPESCPIIEANPENLEEVLAWCAENRDTIAALGRCGRRYVERHYSYAAVAVNLGKMYLDTARFSGRLAQDIAERVQELEGSLPEPLELPRMPSFAGATMSSFATTS